jgi:hypothetical protein
MKKMASKKHKSVKKNSKEKDYLEILSERPVQYVELDIEISDGLRDMIISYAKKEIMNDSDALMNYGFIKAIENGINLKESEKVSKKKNG